MVECVGGKAVFGSIRWYAGAPNPTDEQRTTPCSPRFYYSKRGGIKDQNDASNVNEGTMIEKRCCNIPGLHTSAEP